MKVTPSDPNSLEYYYGCIPGCPKLLARSDTSPWEPPLYNDIDGSGGQKWGSVGKHPIKEKLEGGLRQALLDILTSHICQYWISLDFLRFGFSDTNSQNPVVVWITVQKDKVDIEKAQHIVNLLHQCCIQYVLTQVSSSHYSIANQ